MIVLLAKASVRPRGVKKNCGGQKRKNEKKKFLCTFNDQFKKIFFDGGVIFTEKIRLTRCK